MGSFEDSLIGRGAELGRLRDAAARAEEGSGGVILLAGEAGVGKTRLAAVLAAESAVPVLRGAADRDATAPHGPVASALRSHLRREPEALAGAGPLRDHLALLLPELGEPPAKSDQATLFEAIRGALEAIGPCLVVLDDLQWSDDATLDLLLSLSESIAGLPVLVVGAYRSDELTRTHSLRRVRTELRRRGTLEEVSVGPLTPEQTLALTERSLGGEVSLELGRAVHLRTQGIPFFVEEVGHALRASGRVREGEDGLELDEMVELPVPDTIRDAVLIRSGSLSEAGRRAAEAAAAAGQTFSLELVSDLSDEAGVAELIEHGFANEAGEGLAEFRHALVREAVYEDVPWLRRRELHRDIASRLAEGEHVSLEVAHHWLQAGDGASARKWLVAAVSEFRGVHAHRDAAAAARQALELSAADEDPSERLELLDGYAVCAELAGDHAGATRAWRELAELHRARGATREAAEADRRLAANYELMGERARASEMRHQAAEGFAAAGLAEEAAADRLVAASLLQRRGEHSEAERLAAAAQDEAHTSGRLDLEAEAMGLQGVALAKRGELEAGLDKANAGLSLALERGMTARAGSLYQCLGTVLETSADFGAARDAMDSALTFCKSAGEAGKERVCQECMAYLLRELGEWDRSAELCVELAGDRSGPPASRVVVDAMRGSIAGFRGDIATARPLLAEMNEVSIRIDLLSLQVDTSAALAFVAEADGEVDLAASHCRFLLQRWAKSEDRHYAVWPLRWASSFFARHGDGEQSRACAEALGRIAADSGHAYALAALAHAVGEAALLDGDAALAAEQFTRALELHRGLDVPFERAQISLRAGVALIEADRRDQALECLTEAHRIGRGLGAQPLMAEAADAVAALGEPLEERIGRRAAAIHEGAGLTRRELEVVRLVAEGDKNKEIAEKLVVSTRTVDMHVRNILSKLECRSRVEAAGKAAELGLIEGTPG